MKKVLLTAITLCFMFVCGCKNNKTSEPVKPTDVISLSEAQAVVGDKYELVLEYDAVVDLGNNTYKATYISNPLGAGDPVIVEVMHPSDEFSGSDIKKIYFSGYDNRVNKRKIKGVGSEAYVAFPTLNILEDGHLIRITAGSGDTKEQLDILLNLGNIAVNNLHNYLDK